MSKWEMVKLGEMLKIASGGTPSKGVPEYYKNGTIPWVKTGDLKGQYIDILSVDKITELGLNNSSAKVFPKHTVLIAMYGATIGATAILPTEASTNQACAAFLPSDRVSSEYLYYFLYSHKTKIISLGVGGAQPNISATILKQIEIPLPPLDEQKRIAEELDKISGLIAKRKSQLEKLDLLVKAKFVEMFGDNFPKVKASEICEFITKGTTPKSNKIFDVYKDGYVPYLKVYNLSFDGKLLFDENPQYIQKETHNNFLLRSKVYPHDVLMNIVGPPLGKFCLVPDVYSEYNINQAIAIFRAKPNIVSRYLLYALMNPKTLQPFIESAVGIRQQNISLQQCRDLEIPVPPISLQNLFADYVTKVEQTKTKLQQGLEQLETLYKARMQEYFE